MNTGHCPLCRRDAIADDLRPAEIAGVMFQSVSCAAPPRTFADHPFAVRWLEAVVPDAAAAQEFQDRFVRVRGPLPAGSAIADAFGETDPILAWIEEEPASEGIRLRIRL